MVSLTRLLRLQLHNLDSVCQLTDPRRQRFRRDILTAPGNRIVGDGGGGNAGGSLRISLLAERLGTTDPAPACVVLEAIKLLCLYVNNEEIDESIRLLCLDSLEKVLLNDIREEQLFIEIARCCMVSEVSLGVNRRKVQLIKILISNPTMSTHIPSDILWGYFKLCHYELIQSNDVEAELVIKTLYHLIFSQTLRSQTLRGSKSDDSHQDPPVAWESLRLQFVKYVIRLLNTGLKLNKQRLPSYPCRPVGELPWLQQQTAGDDLHSIDHCERSGLLEQPKANSVVEAGTTAGAGLLTDNSGLNASLSSNPSSVLSSSNWSAEPAPPTDLKAPAGRTSMTDARNAAANIGTDSRLLEGPIGKRVSDVSRGSRIDSADSKLELLQEVDERLVKGREEQLINLGYQLLYDSITVGPEHFKSDGPLKDLLNRYVIPVVWQTQNSVDVSAYVFATQLRFLIPLLTDLNNPVHYQMFINTFAVRNVLLQGLTGGDTSVGTYLNGQHPSTYLTKSVNLLERQEMVCKMILQIFGTIGPQGILSIFENFDCNFQRTPILRRIVIAAIVNAEPEFTPKEIRDPKDASASRSQADSPVIEDAQPQHYTTRVWKSLAIQQGGRGAGGRVRSSYKRVCAVQKAGFDILCKIAECVSLILSQWESERQSSATAPRENAPSPGSVQLVPLSACLSSAAKNLVERRRTEELVHAINQAGPKEISEHLIRAGKIRDEDDVTAVARFLLLTPSLNLSLIGEVLGSKGPWHQQVLDAFLRLFDFNGVSAVSALRMFLGSFKLPGEGQMIDRILDRFGKEYFLQQDIAPGQSITPPSTDPNDPVLTVEERTPRLVVNENGSGRTVFVTSDVVFLLSFAIVMLNTDLHHPDAKTKMSVDNFLANTYRIEDMTTLSALYMRSVYQTIKEDGLAINKQIEEDGLYPTEHPVIDVHTLLQQSELTHAAWEMKDEAVVLELAETLWTEGEFWNTAYIQVMSNCKDFVYFEKGLECFYHLISIWSRFGKADYILAMLADMMQFIHPVCSYK
ncbi:Sec7 domain protein [Gregarina niphandrodes]|uniref:Sec7 domain protein n=1 Tax=Gregarina niphandrodes TaxID=110365 RepID=A0A023BB56_GRENI|nr:Sec7 domain protein [Gregarina niphandrodes]EZG79249.1 Sec7 domain protein [Gregarina niphandrodes]|eukprot:XP_011129096.1 Sec7 domain protein [Gregarina niphandrodes]